MKARKTRKVSTKQKQKGGFYPSVYGGVTTASLLFFAAARQAYRLMKNGKTMKKKKH